MGVAFGELCHTSASTYRGSTIGAITMQVWVFGGCSGYSSSESVLLQYEGGQGVGAGGTVLVRLAGETEELDTGGKVSGEEVAVCV
jgi:hypothetical protein